MEQMMATQRYEFQSHNSPWTELFNFQSQQEEMAEATTPMQQDTQDEQQPTHDALVDVYNRDDKAAKHSKRF
jgi:hypothetical protein